MSSCQKTTHILIVFSQHTIPRPNYYHKRMRFANSIRSSGCRDTKWHLTEFMQVSTSLECNGTLPIVTFYNLTVGTLKNKSTAQGMQWHFRYDFIDHGEGIRTKVGELNDKVTIVDDWEAFVGITVINKNLCSSRQIRWFNGTVL